MGDGYNGWTNYETWNLALWIDSDHGEQQMWRERAGEAYRNAKADKPFTRKERAALAVADWLKEQTEEEMPEVQGFYADVLQAAVGEVNWYEIATHWVDEVADEIDEEEKAEAVADEE